MIDRYSRQVLFPGISEEGQKKLGNSYAVIIGCGALGTIIATSLVRAGVGKIRIVDRDFIEYHNLQRQVLFDEEDIRNNLPKAIAAEQHLKKVNSSIEIEGVVADVNHANIERLITGADLVLDALDNLETRFLINDVALKHSIPWIYGAAISSQGMSMTVLPHETACFRCLVPSPTNRGLALTCDTAGVISPAPFIIGSLQTAEAMKILVGAKREINRDLVMIDVWENSFHRLKINPRPDCPTCQGEYEFLKAMFVMKTTVLCGQNAVQVLNAKVGWLSLDELATRLRPIAEVSYSAHMLRFKVDNNEMVVFPDGRAILRDSTDESLARGLYAKYVGT
jgi:adenylyltransferase/sulfurtransferase